MPDTQPCDYCGVEIRFLPHPDTGKVTPYDVEPAIHYKNKEHIKATRDSKKPKAVPEPKPEHGPYYEDAVAGLVQLGTKATEARARVAEAEALGPHENGQSLLYDAIKLG